MKEILDKISEIIIKYDGGEWQSVDNLRLLLRELSANYYYLTKYNIEAFQRHNAIQYMHKGAVGRGLILANEQVPELRKTRKLLMAADRVINSIRSEISTINKEQ